MVDILYGSLLINLQTKKRMSVDAQGNIVGILDSNGNEVVKYVYDAWGNHAVLNADGTDCESGIGVLNPFRYRGYFYDTQTGLYYLKTRYYDPEIGRFISQDSIEYADPETINGLNLYVYCGNNPVMRTDSTGTNWWTDFWNGVGNWFKGNWEKLLIGAAFIIGGALVTALTAGAGVGFFAAFGSALLSSTVQTGISMMTSAVIEGTISALNGNGFFKGFTDGLADGFMWGGILSGASQLISGGFRVLRSSKGFLGLDKTNFALLSPDKLFYDFPGITLIRIGTRKGIKFAIDLGKYGVHMHFLTKLHIPLIPIIVGLIKLIKR